MNYFVLKILDAATGRIVREFTTHTYPVQGLEWTSLNSLLSYGYQNLSGLLFEIILVRVGIDIS